MMGGGPALDKLKQKNISMGLESFVEFLGRVTDHDLCRYLSTADICLDPDPYTEWADQSTMNKIMEYMTFSKPTVAFDLTENRYSAQEAAVYVKPNDTQEFATMINQLLNDEETRLQMGTFGQERVRRELAWDYSKPALLAAYAKVTSS
jgi:glycosyltransferase involved in cell wall biosynthesis